MAGFTNRSLCIRSISPNSCSTAPDAVLDVKGKMMANVTANTTDFHGALLARLADTFTNLSDAHAKRVMYRRTVSELSALNNRELADLGLSRASIKAVAWETTYGK